MKDVVSKAITRGIAFEDVEKMDNAELMKAQENQIEGVTKDD